MGKITINQDSLKTSRDWVRHKINPGTNIYRILPPFGEVSVHNNYPYRRWATTWLQDPKSGTRRPFASPLTEGEECPVREYVEELKKHVEARKAELKADGYSDSDIKTELEGLNSVLWNIRVQFTYAYNAADQSGTVGILELKSTAHQGVKKRMNQYIKEYGQDPTSLNSSEDDSGVWFAIEKDGKGKDTEYNVDFNYTKTKVNGQLMKSEDRTALSDNIVENYNDLAYDLNAIYNRRTYAELRDILLFNLALIAKEVPEAILPGYEVDGVEVEVAPAKKSAPQETRTASRPAAKVNLNLGSDGDDEADVAPRTTRQAPAAKAAAPAPTTRKVAPAPASVNDDEMDALTRDILGE